MTTALNVQDRSTGDKIEKAIELRAPISKVWHAVTDHIAFGTWFQVALDGPFVVGEISTGQITYPGYEHVAWRVLVEVIEPETRFVFRGPPSDAGPDVDLTSHPTTLVEFHLEPTETGTRLTITESGFLGIPEAMRLEAYPRNNQGWDEQTRNITAFVES